MHLKMIKECKIIKSTIFKKCMKDRGFKLVTYDDFDSQKMLWVAANEIQVNPRNIY